MLTEEMSKIKVDFKFYEEFNQLAEKSEKKWTALDGKQLQTVLEKLNITRIMEAVGEIDAEGVNELWGAKCSKSKSPYFLYFPLFTQSLLTI